MVQKEPRVAERARAHGTSNISRLLLLLLPLLLPSTTTPEMQYTQLQSYADYYDYYYNYTTSTSAHKLGVPI